MLHPKTLDIAVPLIEEFEGVRYEAYLCPAGIPTICAGLTRYSNGTPVRMGDVCTDVACKGYLNEMLTKEFEPCLCSIPKWNEFGPNRQAAMLSFAWNMGERFYGSPNFQTITRVLRDGAANPEKYNEMRDALMLYVKGGGQTLPGLVRRREAEADLWEKEDDGQMVITVLHDTYFKKAAIDSQYLSDGSGKLPVKAGNSLEISKLEEVAGNNHAEIVVEDTGDTWFIYLPHWEISSAKKS